MKNLIVKYRNGMIMTMTMMTNAVMTMMNMVMKMITDNYNILVSIYL